MVRHLQPDETVVPLTTSVRFAKMADMSLANRVKESVPLGLRKSAKVSRASAFEHAGSFRYSMPALNGLDRKMLGRLPDSGVFLEVGANDGYSQSNTYYLERARGWSGILIEPLPSLYERCRRLRKASTCVQAACVAEDIPGATIDLIDLDLMSVTLGQQDVSEERARLGARRGATVKVPARSLSSVIDGTRYARIDFMSIDVEGAELPLLSGLDLARHAPSWLLIETDHPTDVGAALAPHLKQVDQLSHHDYLFSTSDH